MFSAGNSRGGIGIRVVFVFVTLAVVGISVVSLLEVQRSDIRKNHRIAMELSDLGLQQALESNAETVLLDPKKFTGVPRTIAQNGWYEVAVSFTSADSSISITLLSTGLSGSERVVQSRRVDLVRSGTDSSAVWQPKD